MAILSVEQLSVRFSGLTALKDVTFDVNEKEVVSVIGPNGAGKTTLFNCITGFIRPSGGKITFAGEDITGRKPHEISRAGIVRTFQKRSFFPNLTVAMNLMIACQGGDEKPLLQGAGLQRIDVRNRELRERAEALAEQMGLASRLEEISQSLPYGAQRRLGVACALAANPRVLLLDEPCAGMNPAELVEMIALIQSLKERAMTMVIVEHHMRFVMEIFDRVVVLDHGVKLAEGKPAEIRRNPQVIEAYLGRRETA